MSYYKLQYYSRHIITRDYNNVYDKNISGTYTNDHDIDIYLPQILTTTCVLNDLVCQFVLQNIDL